MGFKLDIEGFEDLLPYDLEAVKPVIDLRECEFVYPEGALGVFLLLRYWIRQRKRPLVKRPTDYDVNNYFERTGVPRATYDVVDYQPNTFGLFSQKWNELETMQEITPVTSQTDVARIVEKFGGSLKQQYQDKEIVMSIQSAMLETFQNMPDHASLGKKENFEGYANIQMYEDKSRVVVAAGDLGVGIRGSLCTNKKYSRVARTDLSALKLVVDMAASRYDEDGLKSRGGGLQRAIENVKAVNGSAVIRSGTAAILIKPRTALLERSGLKFFPGTQITIKVSNSMTVDGTRGGVHA